MIAVAVPARERPILFSGEMVRAILDGRKTQTRRVADFPADTRAVRWVENEETVPKGKPYTGWVVECGAPFLLPRRCPYGAPDDRLWVRETWQYTDWTEDGYPFIGYAADESRALMDRGIRDEWSDKLADVWTDLSAPENYAIDNRAADRRWRPSIHMPRWASRITLELTGVRVERLQDISHDDVLAEGIDRCNSSSRIMALERFEKLWNGLNADRGCGWDANPWVWVLEFRRGG